ncbi:hypothetical protein [Kribbella swartbergensis]
MTAPSWAALLDLAPAHTDAWTAATTRLPAADTCRDLREADVSAALALDAAIAGDYPGSVATAHEAFTAKNAVPTARRRSFGVFDPDGRLAAMTLLEVEAERAEVDFTVVARDRRRQGLATAPKAASLLALARDGVTVVRTGGSEENRGILPANQSLGFGIDEHWVTMTPPAR